MSVDLSPLRYVAPMGTNDATPSSLARSELGLEIIHRLLEGLPNVLDVILEGFPGRLSRLLELGELPGGRVPRLTRLFEDVRYGTVSPGKREEQQAIASLKAIAEACKNPT